ncbi:MAG TPA: isoleucine--tRNA ligase [Planctomycetota bacterium]|nr:isoleucine--tRNA ligase [Planctomycetota bacterium]
MYAEIGGERRQQDLEERVLARWKALRVFERSQERRAGAARFTFYEGPPTANGRPGIHHVLSRTLKDTVCRYFDLAGRAVERKAGWDTHGLPVEVEVEKTLGIHGKAGIEAYGLEAFTRRCIDSVFKYVGDWERLTDRIGYWLDLDRAYVTYHEPYVESIWWALKTLYEKGLLYRGHKVVWWWAQGGTALSQQEVGLGYREVEDPSVIVRFPLKSDDGIRRSLLAWTTTPWTLPSNVGLAVAAALEYVEATLLPDDKHPETERVVVGAPLLAGLVGERPHRVERTLRGAELVGRRYEPPLPYATPEGGRAWEVVPGDFVTFDAGTGVVHLAPGFGEDDYRTCREAGLGFLQLVEPDGSMAKAVEPVAGMFVKTADPVLTKELKTRGLLFRAGRVRHEYPFCWRKQEDPLIQYARQSWFVKTTAVKDRLLAHNASVDWRPDHIREGRFGDFLRNNVDWAVSRERFWGTPLPFWINDETGAMDVVASVEDILARNPGAFAAFNAAREKDPSLPADLRVHRPWIDRVTWTKPGEPGVYRRVPEVLDCWFDSGAMPFAQRHYPFENRDVFEASFPADYICEGIDQTRGWFYTLLALSTLLFERPAYRHVIVNGHINDKHGKKMSKSLGNTVDPWTVMDAYGADPLRWHLLGGSPPWLPKAFDPEQVGEVARKVFGTLWPSYNFFALYAGVDRWKPGGAPPAARTTMDRWLLSRAHSTLRDFRAAYEDFDPQRAVRLVGAYLDELSNWYIRRNRARFWKSTDDADKHAAYDALHRALTVAAYLLAPIAPFSADALYVALHPEGSGADSIFLTDLPAADASLIDAALEARMAAVVAVTSLARAARTSAGLRVRQPLARLVVSGPDLAALRDPELQEEIKDELNVKALEVAEKRGGFVDVTVKPNLKTLGPRLGPKLRKVSEALKAPSDAFLASVEETGGGTLLVDGEPVRLGAEDLLVSCVGRAGFAAAAERGSFAALDTALTPELEREGLARETLNRLQTARKDAGLAVSDRVRVILSGSEKTRAAAAAHADLLKSEALATDLSIVDSVPEGATTFDLDGEALALRVEKA